MKLEELMNSGPVDLYAIAVTIDGENWFTLNEWKISIKKCIGSYNNSTSYRKLEDFKEIKFLKRSFNTKTTDITPTDLSTYGINKKK